MVSCLEQIRQVNKEVLTDEDLIEILEQLQGEKKRRQAEGSLKNIQNAILQKGEEIASEAELRVKIEKRNFYDNIIKEEQLIAKTERADDIVGRPDLGYESAFFPVNTPFEGAGRSVSSLNSGYDIAWMGGLTADLKKQGLEAKFTTMSGDFERDVTRYLWDLNKKNPEGLTDIPADAKAIAELMYKYRRQIVKRENEAGAYIMQKDGRAVGTVHDAYRIKKSGFDNWKKEIENKIDYDEMGISLSRRPKFLEILYKTTTTGIRKASPEDRGSGFARSDISKAFKGPSNLAKRESAASLIVWNNADDWYDYNKMFGRPSVREAFIGDMQAATRATAVMDIFGTNPQAMHDRVIKRLEEKYENNPEKLKGIQRDGVYAVKFDAALAEVTGDINRGSETPFAVAMNWYRTVQTVAKLGGVTIAALGDTAFIAAARIYQGRSLMDAWGDGFSAFFKGMEKGQIRDIADRAGIGLEGQMGELMGQMRLGDSAPGQASRLMSSFFKLNLLTGWTDANKRGVGLMISNDFGREAKKTFDKLPEDQRRILSIYGIDKKGWDVVRKAAKMADNKKMYLIPGEIKDQAMRENFFSLLTSEIDNAVITAGARERTIVKRGYRPGTSMGEALRLVGQFKTFGVTALTKTYGRHLYGYGAKGWREQLQRGAGANMGMINTIAGTTVMGYFIMQLKELAKGREPRPHDTGTLFAAMLQGGGAALYGDFLFAQHNRFGGGLMETAAGPGFTEFFDLLNLGVNLRDVILTGEGDARADAIRLFKSNMPLQNLFYTKQVTDYLIWYQFQEMLNPGYLQRMERRTEKQNDTSFWLPPSSIVQTGGGLR